MENVLYHLGVAVGFSPSLSKVDHDKRPHSHDIADDLKKRRHWQLSCNDGTTKTGTWHHPDAMLCPIQACDNNFRHRGGIQKFKDGRSYLLQARFQEKPIEYWVLYQLVTVPTSQLIAVSVGRHMRPTRISNKERLIIHSSQNWLEHWQVLCGINGEAVCNDCGNPTESVLLPRSYEGLQWYTTLLEFQTVQKLSLSPTNHAWQNLGWHSGFKDWLKAKEQCKLGMRRSDSGNLRNLPQLRHESRLLQCWLTRRLAQTAPTAYQWVHNCLPSSVHPPSKTCFSEQATAGQQHHPHQRSSPPQTDAHGHAPQGDPPSSWSSPSLAPRRPRLRDFRGNPAPATQLFPDAEADHGQNDDSLGNAATLHDSHVWAQRHFSATLDIKNGLAYWQRLMVLSRRICHAQMPRTPSSCGKFPGTEFSGALCWCLSHLRWCLTSELSVHIAMALVLACPALHSVLSTERRILYTKHDNCWAKSTQEILTIHQRRQQLCFLLPANGATKKHHLMTTGRDESQWQQDRWRTDLNGTNVVKIWSQHGAILVISSFEHKKYHHQTPAPTTPGSYLHCGQPKGHHSGAPS